MFLFRRLTSIGYTVFQAFRVTSLTKLRFVSLEVMSLAKRMRFGQVDEIWFGGSSSLGSSQEKFSVREMRSETSIGSC